MDTSVLLGMNIDDARVLTEQHGLTIRDADAVGTCEVNLTRINVEIENDIITKVCHLG